MGSNIVRLTDRTYMLNLQRRVHEDHESTLNKRIEQRKLDECECEKLLILNGMYNPENCPPRLVKLHSIVLSQEMERARKLLLNKKNVVVPYEMSSHPVFATNNITNKQIIKRRSKMMTTKERNCANLIKRGHRWEKERLESEEVDKKRAEEIAARRDAALALESFYVHEYRNCGMNLLKIRNCDFAPSEYGLKAFLEEHKKKMLRSAIGEKNTLQRVDEQDLDSKELSLSIDISKQSSTESFPHIEQEPKELTPPPPPVKEKKKGKGKGKKKKNEEEVVAPEGDGRLTVDQAAEKARNVLAMEEHVQNAIGAGHMLKRDEYRALLFEDPKIVELKKTENVDDMYALAAEIILGQTPNDYLKKKQGDFNEEKDQKEGEKS